MELKVTPFKNPKLYYFKTIDHSTRMTRWRPAEEYESDLVPLEITGWLVAEDRLYFHVAWAKMYAESDAEEGCPPRYSEHWLVPKKTILKKKLIKI